MEKKTKALIVGGLGAALLLGAGGTFALWTDSFALTTRDTVTAGTLKFKEGETVSLNGSWVWHKLSNPTDAAGKTLVGQPFDIETNHLVPGDAVLYTFTKQDIATILEMTGETLQAELSLEYDGEDETLGGLTVSVDDGTDSVFLAFPTDWTQGDSKPSIPLGTVKPGASGTDASAVVIPEIVVGIKYSAEDQNNLKGASISANLSSLKLVVTQTVSDDYYGASK